MKARMRVFCVAGAVAMLCGSGAATFQVKAAERMEGKADLKPHLGKALRLLREDEAVTLTDTSITVAFVDPRPEKEIERIMNDPKYRPPEGEFAAFWTQTTISALGFDKPISEKALCDWDDNKRLAECIIEDDGGGFEIAAERPANGPPKFTLIVRPMQDYTGFRIAADDSKGEMVGIEMRLVGKKPVRLPITLGP